MIRAITRDIGGSALAQAALAGGRPEWYAPVLKGAAGWAAAAAAVANDFADRDWRAPLMPALAPSNASAIARLDAASLPGGLVVTGGQQPGLFGGPMYVLYKALTLLELANALEAVTGRAVAPIFWAATDDADFVEASHVAVVRRGRLDVLTMDAPAFAGRAMARTPLGDVSGPLARLAEACGSAPDSDALNAVRSAYVPAATVGSAYLAALRTLLEPLGVAVLDASHAAVRVAGNSVMKAALDRADDVALALRDRTRAIGEAGFHAQVADVPNLSLVFETLDDGTRRRVPLRAAKNTAESLPAENLGPNVLLRPVMERHILPTVTYVGGPGEVAYFAQVSAVAGALGLALPRISPRWSGTLIEPHIESMLARLRATPDDFADPHAMESRVAREEISPGVRGAIADLRSNLDESCDRMTADEQTSAALARSLGSMRAGVEYRLQRLERRYAAAVKQTGSDTLRDVEHVRASLFPNGAPQERVLSHIPFLARYGGAAVDAVREQVRGHVARVIDGD